MGGIPARKSSSWDGTTLEIPPTNTWYCDVAVYCMGELATLLAAHLQQTRSEFQFVLK